MNKGPYTSVEPVAEYFGVSISTIRQWVRSNKIPESAYIKVGTTYRFHLRAVEDALLNHEGRHHMTYAQRNEIANRIINDLDIEMFGDAPESIPAEKRKDAEAELADKALGIPHVKPDPEVDEALEAILNEHDETDDL